VSDVFAIEIAGLDELMDALDAAGSDIETVLKPAVNDALIYLWENLPIYPPKPAAGEASRYWTDRQRRWFFWALRNGRVDSPYRRKLSGGLRGSMSTEVRSAAGRVEGLVGPNVKYAPYVVGQDKQARIHQGRWWVFEDSIERNMDGAIRIIEAEVARLLATL
jgi:hypothetical protein